MRYRSENLGFIRERERERALPLCYAVCNMRDGKKMLYCKVNLDDDRRTDCDHASFYPSFDTQR